MKAFIFIPKPKLSLVWAGLCLASLGLVMFQVAVTGNNGAWFSALCDSLQPFSNDLYDSDSTVLLQAYMAKRRSSEVIGRQDQPTALLQEHALDAQLVLRSALRQVPVDVNHFSIANMGEMKEGTGTANLTLDVKRFPSDAWKSCRHELHNWTSVADVQNWTSHDASWPVIRESVEGPCLLAGTPTLGVPVLALVSDVPKSQCDNEEEFPSQLLLNGEFPLREFHWGPNQSQTSLYTAIWPTTRSCTLNSPCALSVYMNGNNMDDTHTNAFKWGALRFVAHNSTCRTKLGAILLSPELPHEQAWTEQYLIDDFVLPLVDQFIQEHRGLIDVDRVFAIGASSGATGALWAALRAPHVFSVAVAADFPLVDQTLSVDQFMELTRDWEKMSKPQRLRAVVLTRGSHDEGNFGMVDLVHEVHKKTSLGSYVDLQVRVYPNDGHSSELGTFSCWRDFLNVTFFGKADLYQPPPLSLWAWQILALAVIMTAVITSSVLKEMSSVTLSRKKEMLGGTRSLKQETVDFVQSKNEREPALAQPNNDTKDFGGTKAVEEATLLETRDDLDDSACVISPEDRKLLASFNDTQAPFPDDQCVHQLLLAQASITKQSVSLEFEPTGERLTYWQFCEHVRRLAAHLRQLGVGPDTLVVLILERSVEMVVGIYGIMMAGGAYVPIEPDLPAGRMQPMLESVVANGGSLLITLQSCMKNVDGTVPRLIRDLGLQIVWLDSLKLATPWSLVLGDQDLDLAQLQDSPGHQPRPRSKTAPANLAYAIFTSGSTGRPKGVLVEHRGVVNFITNLKQLLGLRSTDIVLNKNPYSFDASGHEIFPALSAGAKLLVARPGGQKDPQYLLDIIQHVGVTSVAFVPSMFAIVMEALRDDQRRLSSLRNVCLGGERVTPALCRDFFKRLPSTELYDVYGPTEASIMVTALHCTEEVICAIKPLGRLLHNVTAHVVNSGQTTQPLGKPGELLLGGVQLARGYLGLPEKTAEVFILNPVCPESDAKYHGRWYRTGDLVKWRRDGLLVYLGRIDHQVKLHGQRVELGEIEAVVRAVPQVVEAVAVLHKDEATGAEHLVAYVSPSEAASSPQAILDKCLEVLPSFMVPSLVMGVDSWPRTASGKLDRKSLPAPSFTDFKHPTVEDSLGRARRLMARADVVEYNIKVAMCGLGCLFLLWTHWLPHSKQGKLLYVAPWLIQVVDILQQTMYWLMLLFGILGYNDFKSLIHGRDMAKVALLYVAMGWPHWFPSAGFATFHRWTCLIFMIAYTSVRVFQACRVPWVVQLALILGAVPIVGSVPLRIPFIPLDAVSVWQQPSLLFFEPQFFGTVGYWLMLLAAYFVGYHVVPVSIRKFRQSLGNLEVLMRVTVRLAAGAILIASLVWEHVSAEEAQLHATPKHSEFVADCQGCYDWNAYPLTLLQCLVQVVCTLAMVGEGNFMLRLMGQQFMGTYLVHMYIQLDLVLLLEALLPYGSVVQLLAILLIPTIYILSVGFCAQRLISAILNPPYTCTIEIRKVEQRH